MPVGTVATCRSCRSSGGRAAGTRPLPAAERRRFGASAGRAAEASCRAARNNLCAARKRNWSRGCRAGFFASTAAVMAHIETCHGIVYSKPGTIKLLHRMGFVPQAQGLAGQGRCGGAGSLRGRLRETAQSVAADEVVYFSDDVMRVARSAIRKTRHDREIMRTLWSRVPPALQLPNVFGTAKRRDFIEIEVGRCGLIW
jgi:hypothetical protein